MADSQYVALFVAAAVVFIGCRGTDGRLAVTPHDAVVVAGSPVTLKCRTDLNGTTVNWSQRPAGSRSRLTTNRIFVDGLIPESKRARYAIDSDGSTEGSFNLVVVSTDATDGGLYMCRDDRGFSDYAATAQLIVIDRTVECSSTVDDPSTMFCVVNYAGSAKPNIALLPSLNVDDSTSMPSARNYELTVKQWSAQIPDVADSGSVNDVSCTLSLKLDRDSVPATFSADAASTAVAGTGSPTAAVLTCSSSGESPVSYRMDVRTSVLVRPAVTGTPSTARTEFLHLVPGVSEKRETDTRAPPSIQPSGTSTVGEQEWRRALFSSGMVVVTTAATVFVLAAVLAWVVFVSVGANKRNNRRQRSLYRIVVIGVDDINTTKPNGCSKTGGQKCTDRARTAAADEPDSQTLIGHLVAMLKRRVRNGKRLLRPTALARAEAPDGATSESTKPIVRNGDSTLDVPCPTTV